MLSPFFFGSACERVVFALLCPIGSVGLCLSVCVCDNSLVLCTPHRKAVCDCRMLHEKDWNLLDMFADTI